MSIPYFIKFTQLGLVTPITPAQLRKFSNWYLNILRNEKKNRFINRIWEKMMNNVRRLINNLRPKVLMIAGDNS